MYEFDTTEGDDVTREADAVPCIRPGRSLSRVIGRPLRLPPAPEVAEDETLVFFLDVKGVVSERFAWLSRELPGCFVKVPEPDGRIFADAPPVGLSVCMSRFFMLECGFVDGIVIYRERDAVG